DDVVLVSGTLGDAALGLRVLRGELGELGAAQRAALAARHRVPEPRLALGRALAEGRLASAALDVSDGLVADLGHICEASRVGATVEIGRLPRSAAGAAALAVQPDLQDDVLGGGEDYELLFAAPETAIAGIEAAAAAVEVPVTVIGRLSAEPGVRVLDRAGGPIKVTRPGWTHF